MGLSKSKLVAVKSIILINLLHYCHLSINKTILDDFDKYLIFSVSLILRVVMNFVTGSQHWRRLLILKCVINNEDK